MNDTLWRIGKDDKLYVQKGQDWDRVGSSEVFDVSATSDALWILDFPTFIPYKFDSKSQKFV